jgi:hypothetical protein
MDWSDRHYRYFRRQISAQARPRADFDMVDFTHDREWRSPRDLDLKKMPGMQGSSGRPPKRKHRGDEVARSASHSQRATNEASHRFSLRSRQDVCAVQRVMDERAAGGAVPAVSRQPPAGRSPPGFAATLAGRTSFELPAPIFAAHQPSGRIWRIRLNRSNGL